MNSCQASLIYWAIKGQANSLTGFFFLMNSHLYKKENLAESPKGCDTQIRVFSTEQMQGIGKEAVRPKILWAVLMYLSPQGHKEPISEFLCSLQMCAHSRKALHLDQVCHSQSSARGFTSLTACRIVHTSPLHPPAGNRGSPHPLVTTNPAFHSLCSLARHRATPCSPTQCAVSLSLPFPLHYVANKLLSISPVQYQSVRCSTSLNYFGQRISHLLTGGG